MAVPSLVRLTGLLAGAGPPGGAFRVLRPMCSPCRVFTPMVFGGEVNIRQRGAALLSPMGVISGGPLFGSMCSAIPAPRLPRPPVNQAVNRQARRAVGQLRHGLTSSPASW